MWKFAFVDECETNQLLLEHGFLCKNMFLIDVCTVRRVIYVNNSQYKESEHKILFYNFILSQREYINLKSHFYIFD